MRLARHVEPEWLDQLGSEDPSAVASRRDLRRLNSLMLHAAIVARILSAEPFSIPCSILDIGGGDGTFMLALARRLAGRVPEAAVTLVDTHSTVSNETRRKFAALGWRIAPVRADILEFLEAAPPKTADLIIANLFLHHFCENELARLFRHAASAAPLLVACEPRRTRLALRASRLMWAIGCNEVTQHDAQASVRAGFRDQELSMLWPREGFWQLEEGRAGPFSHRFIARHVS
jgi:hypothetical protein